VQTQMVRDATPDEVVAEIAKNKYLFIDCWAPDCSYCLKLGLVFEELEAKYAHNEDISFLKVDTKAHPQFTIDYEIPGIPCVLIYVNGEPTQMEIQIKENADPLKLDRLVGLRPTEQYELIVRRVIGI
jgi:thioredoxin 1